MATYRHMVECRNCGALYRFDDHKETPRGLPIPSTAAAASARRPIR